MWKRRRIWKQCGGSAHGKCQGKTALSKGMAPGISPLSTHISCHLRIFCEGGSGGAVGAGRNLAESILAPALPLTLTSPEARSITMLYQRSIPPQQNCTAPSAAPSTRRTLGIVGVGLALLGPWTVIPWFTSRPLDSDSMVYF